MCIDVLKNLITVTAREHTNTFRAFLNLVILYHSLIICVFPVYFIIYGAEKC